MSSDIETLVRLLPPPNAPNRQAFERADLVHRLGTNLPNDYFEFVERYGLGMIDSFFLVLPPSSESGDFDLVSECKRLTKSFEALRSEFGLTTQYVGFPAPGGLIPWGSTDNGDVAFWKTGDPDPNRWSVVVGDGRMSDFEQYAGTMAQFLIGLLSGKLQSKIFPDGFPSSSPTFLPE